MFKIRLYALKLCIHSVNLLRCTFITCAMIHVLISFCLWLSCHFNRKHFSGKKKEAKLQVNECWCQGERLHWPLWKEFWPDGVQHRRKGGDLTADLIDLLCCRSVFSLLAGSDPETPHAHAHACKTHHKNICKHSDKQMWFIPHGQSCQFHAGLNRHANTDRGGKHAGITLSLFYHPSGPKLGSNTAKIHTNGTKTTSGRTNLLLPWKIDGGSKIPGTLSGNVSEDNSFWATQTERRPLDSWDNQHRVSEAWIRVSACVCALKTVCLWVVPTEEECGVVHHGASQVW